MAADAGMISEANQVALQSTGLSYILGASIPFLPDVVRACPMWCANGATNTPTKPFSDGSC
jgi:hypothetical protein